MKRREWVKNAAIIFLSVMLVLTFFSNTFMNYSLPMVAAQYVQSGNITAKIRGTGTIESGDPYVVQISESRTISSVKVKAGDVVQKDDILFLLEDVESTELQTLEEELDNLILSFEKAMLSGTITNTAINNVQNSNISTLTEYQNKITAANTKIDACQAEVDAVTLKIAEKTTYKNTLSYGNVDTSAEELEKYNAENKYNQKNEELTLVTSSLSSLQSELAAAKKTVNDYNNGILTVSGNEAEYESAIVKIQKLPEQITTVQAQVTALQAEAYNLGLAVTAAQKKIDNKTGNSATISALNIELEKLNLELSSKQAALQEATDARSQLLSDISSELDLNTQYEQIAKKGDEIEKLREESIGTTIVSPISGTVSTVSLQAGQTTTPDTPIITMQPEGAGYSASFSVTNEQAKQLSVGDKAELVNAWYYSDMNITLTSIKPDTTNPGSNKMLTFSVAGEVTAGQSLNISVGQKSASYDMIVPNSAIREDNNGKFVLIVETKSSPLGNRYVATRIDVEVVASDDTQSAITGALYGYEFVITTSNKPVEAGDLVRLAE